MRAAGERWVRRNSSAAMSATEGSTRSGRAIIRQKRSRTCRGRKTGGSTASSGRRTRTSGTSSRAAAKGHRGGEQAQGAHPARRPQADLQRDPSAHRVADQVGAVDRQRIHQAQHVAGEEAGVVGGERLGGGAEAGQVDRVHGVVGRERGHGLVEGALRPAQPVDEDRVLRARGRPSGRRSGRRAPARRAAAAAAGGRREA